MMLLFWKKKVGGKGWGLGTKQFEAKNKAYWLEENTELLHNLWHRHSNSNF